MKLKTFALGAMIMAGGCSPHVDCKHEVIGKHHKPATVSKRLMQESKATAYITAYYFHPEQFSVTTSDKLKLYISKDKFETLEIGDTLYCEPGKVYPLPPFVKQIDKREYDKFQNQFGKEK